MAVTLSFWIVWNIHFNLYLIPLALAAPFDSKEYNTAKAYSCVVYGGVTTDRIKSHHRFVNHFSQARPTHDPHLSI